VLTTFIRGKLHDEVWGQITGAIIIL